MKRIKRPLLISIIFVVVAIWLWVSKQGFIPKPFCPFHKLTGIPCPGCGGTRAAWKILDGHIGAAIQINPLSVLLILFLLCVFLFSWIDFLFKTNLLKPLIQNKWSYYIVIPIVCLIIFVWIRNVYIGI